MKYAIIENEVFARLNLQNIVETLRPGYQLVFTAETSCRRRHEGSHRKI